MPIHVDWTNTDTTVIHWRFEKNWTWEDFYAAKQQCLTMVNTADKPIDIILDFGSIPYLPAHTLTHFGLTLRQNIPLHLNRVIVVGANDVLRKVCAILRRLYPAEMSKVSEAPSIDHALNSQAESQMT